MVNKMNKQPKLIKNLNPKIHQEFDILNKRLNNSLDKSLQIELKNFLDNGLVTDPLNNLFKDRYRYSNEDFNFELKFALMALRYSFVEKFGFVLLNEKLINVASDFLKDKKVCEIGAGTGWLSHNLQKNNVDIIPIDYKPGLDSDFGFKFNHTNITICNGIEYLENNFPDVILLSWPDYDTSFASQILEKMKPGQTLVYIGEGYGGCTGDDRFFDLLNKKTQLNEKITDKLQEHSLSWSGVHDTWYVYNIIQ